MAESPEKTSPSKRPFRFLLCCFGSSPKVHNHKNPAKGRPDRRPPSLRFRFKKSSATVPLDAAAAPCHHDAFFSPEFKKPPPWPPVRARTPVVRAEITESLKPSQTRKKTESTRSDSAAERFPPAKRATAVLRPVSRPSVAAVATAVPENFDRRKPAARPRASQPASRFDPVIVIVAVAILVLWGRVCATLCTAALFHLSRRLGPEVGAGGGGGERRVLNRDGRNGLGKIS